MTARLVRVLVVDDSPTARASSRGLERYGFDVRTAATPEEGERDAIVMAEAGVLDVVLCDVVMLGPEGTANGGMKLVRRLARNERTRRIPVVLWTATPRERMTVAATVCGARALVLKSESLEELASVLLDAAGR